MTFLKKIDIIGEEIKFNLQNHERSKTLLGGIFTLIMGLLLVSSAWIQGNDIIFKRKPFVYKRSVTSKEYPLIEITSDNFPLGIFPSDLRGVYEYNERYLKLEARHVAYGTINGNKYVKNVTYLELERCKHKNYPKFTEEEFNNSILTNCFCIKNQNVTLNGYWTEQEGQGLSVKYKVCNNETYSSCASHEEIKKYIATKGISLGIVYLQTLIDFNDFDNPFQTSISLTYKFAHSELSKFVNIMINEGSLETDIGLVGTDIQQKYYLQLNEDQNDAASYNEIDRNLITINFYGSNSKEINIRKYVKIQEIIGFLGGYLKFFQLIFYYLNLQFSIQNKYTSIINQIFTTTKNNFNEIRKSNYTIIDTSMNKLIDRLNINNEIIFNSKAKSNLSLNKKSFSSIDQDKKIHNLNHRINKLSTPKFNIGLKDSLKLGLKCCFNNKIFSNKMV